MKLLKSHPILSIANSFVIDSPSPSNLSYLWNYGSLLGLCLVIQIITGVTLAMHYTPSVDLAFLSVEHITRDVNFGWLLRYIHANVASFFFFFVYLHIGKGLYYGSYRSPRTLLWSIGVIIFVAMIATAFLGYIFSPKWFIYFYEFLPIGSNILFCEGFEDLPSVMQFNSLHLSSELKVAKETLQDSSGIYCLMCQNTGTIYRF